MTEEYRPLSSAGPDAQHARRLYEIETDTLRQQARDRETERLNDLRQRLGSVLSDLVELGLPGSSTIELVKLLPARGLAAYIERKRLPDNLETARVSLLTGGRTWGSRYERRLLVVQRVTEGYELNHVYDNRAVRNRYALISGEVGVELADHDLLFESHGGGFGYRGCVGILENQLTPLDGFDKLHESDVTTLESFRDARLKEQS